MRAMRRAVVLIAMTVSIGSGARAQESWKAAFAGVTPSSQPANERHVARLLRCNRVALIPTKLRLVGGRPIAIRVLTQEGQWSGVRSPRMSDVVEATASELMCLAGGRAVSGIFASTEGHFFQIRVDGRDSAFKTSSPERASVFALDIMGNWAPAFLPARPDSGSYSILTFSPADSSRRAEAAAVVAKDEAHALARARREVEERRALERRNAEARRQAVEIKNARRRAELLARGWSSDLVEGVLRRQVAIGMTTEMVREAWGRPSGINTTTTARGTTEQWVYSSSYVYFTNGAVSAIQQSR
jgi:hypothetical protein